MNKTRNRKAWDAYRSGFVVVAGPKQQVVGQFWQHHEAKKCAAEHDGKILARVDDHSWIIV